jgi:hypothetical protein
VLRFAALREDGALLDVVVAVTSFPAYDRLGATAHAPDAADLLHRLIRGLAASEPDTGNAGGDSEQVRVDDSRQD